MTRIVTWNIQLGRRLPLILEGLSRLPPFDVLALQELSEHGGTLDGQRIAEHLGSGWRSAQVTAQVLRGKYQANGFVWNTQRLRALDVSSIALPLPSGRALRALPSSRRNAAILQAEIDHKGLRLYSVHLDVFGISHKHAQFARVIADACHRSTSALTVIGGDMNTYGIRGRPRWTELRRIAVDAGFEELTVGIGWTHRGLGLHQKLDAMFASPMGLSHRRLRFIVPGSDHIPIWVELPSPSELPRPKSF